MEDKKIVDIEETNEVVEDEKKESFFTKAKKTIKKHGKLLIGGAIATAGLIGYLAGKKQSGSSDAIDAEWEFTDDSDSTETTEEEA